MMFKPLNIIGLLVTVVYCNSKNCCYPDQFESKGDLLMGTVDGTGKQSLITIYFALSFDASGKKIYLDEVIQAGNVTVRSVTLQLYEECFGVEFATKRLQYSVVNNSTCSTSKLPEWDKNNCIPDAATQLNQYTLGMNSGIAVQDYRWMVGGLSTKMTVTNDNCVPVFQQIVGTVSGESVMSTSKFENVTMGIKNPNVFDIPEICKGTRTTYSKVPRRIMFPF